MTLGIQRVKNIVRQINPQVRYRIGQNRRIRSVYDTKLDELGRTSERKFQGTVLIDGKWDNPNYWFRYALLRAALGCSHATEIGLLGPYRRIEQTRTMKQLGFTEIADLQRYQPNAQIQELADQLIGSIKTPEDILQLNLPYDFPADTFYDGILKLQRGAFVQIDHPQLRDAFIEYLVSLDAANDVLNKYQPQLVVSSHALGFHACLVWLAIQRGVPTIIPFGDAGIARFWRPRNNREFYDFFDRVTWREYQALPYALQSEAQRTGKAFLQKRFTGGISNLGADYAYKNREICFDRQTVCRQFGWNTNRPIVAVYTSNWFDYPHTIGMDGFRDYYDWTIQTIRVAQNQTDIHWIFKTHPLHEWYGGATLKDVVGPLNAPHVRVTTTRWEGVSMMQGVDGIITFQGTIGIEAPAMGTPVLTAQRGWYGDWQFVIAANGRESYIEKLRSRWWEQSAQQQDERKKQAEAFACFYWARPQWQGDYLLQDDSQQWTLYQPVMDLMDRCHSQIKREIHLISQWYDSNHPHLHAYTMLKAPKWIA